MDIKRIFVAGLLALGLAFSVAAPVTAEAKGKKVVIKHKRKYHRHPVGVRHIGKGTKHKTVVKTSH